MSPPPSRLPVPLSILRSDAPSPQNSTRSRPLQPEISADNECDLCTQLSVRCDRSLPRCHRCMFYGKICCYSVEKKEPLKDAEDITWYRTGSAPEIVTKPTIGKRKQPTPSRVCMECSNSSEMCDGASPSCQRCTDTLSMCLYDWDNSCRLLRPPVPRISDPEFPSPVEYSVSKIATTTTWPDDLESKENGRFHKRQRGSQSVASASDGSCGALEFCHPLSPWPTVRDGSGPQRGYYQTKVSDQPGDTRTEHREMSLVDHPERTPHTSPFSWQDDSEKQDPGNFRYTPLLKWHEWNRHADRPQVGDPFPSSENHKSQLDVFLRTNNTLHTSYPLIQRSRASTTGRLASSRSRSKEEQQIPWDKLTDDEAIQTEYESSQALSQYFLKASNGGVGHSQHQSPSPRVVELGSPPHSPRELLGPPPASHEKRGSYVKGGTARSGIEEFFESALDDYLSRSSQPYSANVLQQAETLAQPPTRSALVQTAPSSEGKNLRSFRAGQSQDGLGPDGANTTTVGTSPGLDFDQAAVDKAMAQIQAGDMSSWFL